MLSNSNEEIYFNSNAIKTVCQGTGIHRQEKQRIYQNLLNSVFCWENLSLTQKIFKNNFPVMKCDCSCLCWWWNILFLCQKLRIQEQNNLYCSVATPCKEAWGCMIISNMLLVHIEMCLNVETFILLNFLASGMRTRTVRICIPNVRCDVRCCWGYCYRGRGNCIFENNEVGLVLESF